MTLKGRSLRNKNEVWLGFILGTITLIMIAGAITIPSMMGYGSVLFFNEVSLWHFLTEPWDPNEGKYGVGQLALGTIEVTLIAYAAAAYTGHFSGVAIACLLPKWIGIPLRSMIESLAGVPTIVLGVFAIGILIPAMKVVGDMVGLYVGDRNSIGAGLAMSLMLIPFRASLTVDSLESLIREEVSMAEALTTNRVRTIRTLLLPAALPAIRSARFLMIGRGLGETMLVFLALGSLAAWQPSFFTEGAAIAPTIMDSVSGDAGFNSPLVRACFAMGALLSFTMFVIGLLSKTKVEPRLQRAPQNYKEQPAEWRLQLNRWWLKSTNNFYVFWCYLWTIVPVVGFCWLVGGLGNEASKAFWQYQVKLEMTVQTDEVDALFLTLEREAPTQLGLESEDPFEVLEFLSIGAEVLLLDKITKNPELVGEAITIWVPVRGRVDQHLKAPEGSRTVLRHKYPHEVAWAERLVAEGKLVQRARWTYFTRSYQSDAPEISGWIGALTGSGWALFVCLLIAIPVGAGTALWQENWASPNQDRFVSAWLTSLASTPSVIFGLTAYGAVVLLPVELKRELYGTPFILGVTLAFMTIPTIALNFRAAFSLVPKGEASMSEALTTSAPNKIWRIVLPHAWRQMVTGTVIGAVQANGETAPAAMLGLSTALSQVASNPLGQSMVLTTLIQVSLNAGEPGGSDPASITSFILVLISLVLTGLASLVRASRGH